MRSGLCPKFRKAFTKSPFARQPSAEVVNQPFFATQRLLRVQQTFSPHLRANSLQNARLFFVKFNDTMAIGGDEMHQGAQLLFPDRFYERFEVGLITRTKGQDERRRR